EPGGESAAAAQRVGRTREDREIAAVGRTTNVNGSILIEDNPAAVVVAASAKKGREDELSVHVEFRDERVAVTRSNVDATTDSRLQGIRDRKVDRAGLTGRGSIAVRIDRNGMNFIGVRTTEVGGIKDGAAGRQGEHEAIVHLVAAG